MRWFSYEKMNGFIDDYELERRFPYVFENDTITVFSADSLPINDKRKIEIQPAGNEKIIIANDLKTSHTVIFFVDKLPFRDGLGTLWTSTTLRVYYFIIVHTAPSCFDYSSANFYFPELNTFYPLASAIKKQTDFNTKTHQIETLTYDESKESFCFFIDNHQIDTEFGVVKKISTGNTSKPIELSGVLSCDFEKGLNVKILLEIYKTIKRLFCFLAHRKSVKLGKVELFSYDENGSSYNSGELHILFDNNSQVENDDILKEMVKYHIVKGKFSSLVQLIADEKLYFECIPINEEESHHITVSSFILDTAAFEWTFEQCYGDIPLSKYRTDVKTDILSTLEKIPTEQGYNSKKKGELKLYAGIVSRVDRSLSEKIIYALKDLDIVLSDFIKAIYRMNDMSFDNKTYALIALDLEYQRNAYAHGQIDRKMKENIVSDTIILEWLNYAMIFKQVGYSNDEIFNIINAIFKRRFKEKKIGGVK